MGSRRALIAVLGLAALLLAGSCGSTSEPETTAGKGGREQSSAGSRNEGERDDAGKQRPPETVKRSHCPPEVPGCAVTEGRIVYVEAVDPDGDGDAHFVVVDGQSITLPGLTAIDLEKGLRPDPLPGVGDLVSAAGPVQTGSYGQEQIHALEFHVAR